MGERPYMAQRESFPDKPHLLLNLCYRHFIEHQPTLRMSGIAPDANARTLRSRYLKIGTFLRACSKLDIIRVSLVMPESTFPPCFQRSG